MRTAPLPAAKNKRLFRASLSATLDHWSAWESMGIRTTSGDRPIVRQEANRIENDSLLPKGTGEKGMDLVDDQHAHFQLPGRVRMR
jgi:hypothetical protein